MKSELSCNTDSDTAITSPIISKVKEQGQLQVSG